MDSSEAMNEDRTIDVGKQIRMLRENRGLSQQVLASNSGLSRNTLSLIERGLTSPTVSTLKSLASALSVDINAFFQSIDEINIVYTKAEHRPHLLLDHGTLADLGLGMLEQLVTPLLVQLEPGARSGPPLTHDGQDFLYCLSGEIFYSVNGRGYLLEPGDSILFDGHLPHAFRNAGIEVASLLLVMSSPHDGSQYIAGHFPKES